MHHISDLAKRSPSLPIYADCRESGCKYLSVPASLCLGCTCWTRYGVMLGTRQRSVWPHPPLPTFLPGCCGAEPPCQVQLSLQVLQPLLPRCSLLLLPSRGTSGSQCATGAMGEVWGAARGGNRAPRAWDWGSAQLADVRAWLLCFGLLWFLFSKLLLEFRSPPWDMLLERRERIGAACKVVEVIVRCRGWEI